MLWQQVVEDLLLSRGRAWAHLCTLTNLPLSARPSMGEGTQGERVKVSFVARQNSLRSLRDDAVVGAERAYGNRPSCKLVAAARKKFDAEPYRAVVA